MLRSYVHSTLANLAPYLQVGQRVEFSLNARWQTEEVQDQLRSVTFIPSEETGNKIQFYIVYTKEMKKHFDEYILNFLDPR